MVASAGLISPLAPILFAVGVVGLIIMKCVLHAKFELHNGEDTKFKNLQKVKHHLEEKVIKEYDDLSIKFQINHKLLDKCKEVGVVDNIYSFLC